MSENKMLKGSEKLIYLINVFFAISLVVSYALPYISPEKTPKISILSLLFPLLFGVNMLFCLYWLLKGKKQLFLSLSILLLGFNYFNDLYKLKGKEIIKNSDLRIMSYNVRMFNHYHWNQDDSLAFKTLDFIHKKDPDILLLQEFYNDEQLAFQYPYHFVKMKSKTNKFGLAIFSKYSIINSGSLDFKNSANNIIFCDILVGKDTIRTYNIHLESLKVNTEKENFGEENSEKLIGRLAHTFKKQAEQVELYTKHENEWKGKIIVGGDFNNTAFSWAYHTIKGDKLDAFVEAGKGLGKTFDYRFPLRIDFILSDKTFQVNHFKRYQVEFSDHYPIVANLSLD